MRRRSVRSTWRSRVRCPSCSFPCGRRCSAWSGSVGPRPWPDELVEPQLPRGLDHRPRDPACRTGAAQISKGLGVEFEGLDLELIALLENGSSWAVVRRDLGILGSIVRRILRGEGLAN